MLANIEKVPLWKKDERGRIYEFSTRESSYFLIVYRAKGTASGDHYHKGTIRSKSPEIFYFVSGQAELLLRDLNTGLEEKHLLEEGMRIEIPPYVHHGFKALTDVVFVEFNISEKDFSGYESDTVK